MFKVDEDSSARSTTRKRSDVDDREQMPNFQDALAALHVIELRERDTDEEPGMWIQIQHGCGRAWLHRYERWSSWSDAEAASEDWRARRGGVRFRTVPVTIADASPESRGPIIGTVEV